MLKINTNIFLIVLLTILIACSKDYNKKMEKALDISFDKGKKIQGRTNEFSYSIMKTNSNCKLIYTDLKNISFLNILLNSLNRSLIKFFKNDKSLKSINLPLCISDLIIKFFADKSDKLIFTIPKGIICDHYNDKLNRKEYIYFKGNKNSSKKTTLTFNLQFIENSIYPLWLGTIPPSMIPLNFDNCRLLNYPTTNNSSNDDENELSKYITFSNNKLNNSDDNLIFKNKKLKIFSILDLHDNHANSFYKNTLIQLYLKNKYIIFIKDKKKKI